MAARHEVCPGTTVAEPVLSVGDDVRQTRTLLIDDAARVLGLSRRTVYYRLREGRLAYIRTRCGSRRVIMPPPDEWPVHSRRKNAAAKREPRFKASTAVGFLSS